MNKYLRYLVILACVLYALGKLTYDLGKLAGRYYYANRHIIDPKVKSAAIATARATVKAIAIARAIIKSDEAKVAAAWCRDALRFHVRAQLGDLAPKVGEFVAYTNTTATEVLDRLTVDNLKSTYGNFFKARTALGLPQARSWAELTATVR
ncbi:hypothetical protein VZG28_04925 [Synechococcus elongatus IITB4]|uniref:hypothetical protein n=1 Tax=Synechococcus elongatus TaxID=32046 RepID=UPI0030D31B71